MRRTVDQPACGLGCSHGDLAHSRTPSTRPVMSTRPRPSTVTTAQAPSAHATRRVQPQVGGGLSGGVRPECPVQAHLQEAVSSSATSAAAPPRHGQAGRDERVERAGVSYVPGHATYRWPRWPGSPRPRGTRRGCRSARCGVGGRDDRRHGQRATPARTKNSTAGTPSRSRPAPATCCRPGPCCLSSGHRRGSWSGWL